MTTETMDFRTAYDPIRALQNAWVLLWRAPLPLLVGGILLMLTRSDTNFSVDEDGLELGVLRDPIAWWLVGLVCAGALLLFLLRVLVLLGFAGTVRRVMTSGEGRLGDVFEARGLYVEMLLACLLKGLAHLVVLLPMGAAIAVAILLARATGIELLAMFGAFAALALLPAWIYVALGVALTTEAVAFEGLSPTAALRRSWSLVDGQRWNLLLYCLVLAVVSFLGIFACCIGVLVTGPLGLVATQESYLRLTEGEPPGGFWLDRERSG